MLVDYFKKEDLETFCELCKEFYDSKVALREYDRSLTEKTFERALSGHENLWGLLVHSESAKAPIGYVLLTSYWCNEEGGNLIVLDELFIAKAFQHNGYGKRIMSWIEEEYKNEAVAITLEVLKSNTKALKLYRKSGFLPDGFITYTKKIKLPITQ